MKKFLNDLKYECLYDEVKLLLNNLVNNKYDYIYLQGCIGCGKSILSMIYGLYQSINNKQNILIIDDNIDLAKKSFESTIDLFETNLISKNNSDTIELYNNTSIKFVKYKDEIYELLNNVDFSKTFVIINDLFDVSSFNYLNLCKYLKNKKLRYMTLRVNYNLSDTFDYFVYEEEKQSNTYVWRNVPLWEMKNKKELYKNEDFIEVKINDDIIRVPYYYKDKSNIYELSGIPKK